MPSTVVAAFAKPNVHVKADILVKALRDRERQRRDIAVELEVGAHDDLGLRQRGRIWGVEDDPCGKHQPGHLRKLELFH
jgi:hypothetical protein